MLDQVCRQFSHDERQLADCRFVHAGVLREGDCRTSCGRRLTRLGHRHTDLTKQYRLGHLHLTMLTVVPLPGVLSMPNSFTSRFDPLRPNPRPPRVVYPSFIASSISGMPGPLSTKTALTPRRGPSFSACRRISPPPPWTSVFRASSLAAVTILV